MALIRMVTQVLPRVLPPALPLLKKGLQAASPRTLRPFSTRVDSSPLSTSLSYKLETYVKGEAPIPEPLKEILSHLVINAMSQGSISPVVSEMIARAGNSLGVRTNMGEGGDHSGQHRIVQWSPGGFGFTLEAVLQAVEAEFKDAQGAKPGEGGQLSLLAFLNETIGNLRQIRLPKPESIVKDYATLSEEEKGPAYIEALRERYVYQPAPHHDSYSVEDRTLKRHDLRSVHPKLITGSKTNADYNTGMKATADTKTGARFFRIDGKEGSTGAAKATSVSNTGNSAALGVALAHQALVENGLRDSVKIGFSGGIQTAKDIIRYTLLGGDDAGLATSVLISLGCVMVRQCHSKKCPVGLATTSPEYMAKLKGTQEDVRRFLIYLSQSIYLELENMGLKRLEDIRGRTDLFEATEKIKKQFGILIRKPTNVFPGLSPKAMEVSAEKDKEALYFYRTQIQKNPERVPKIALEISTAHMSVGGRIASTLIRHPEEYPHPLYVRFSGPQGRPGYAGESFGLFLPPNAHFMMEGDANNFVGKLLSGGTIIVDGNISNGLLYQAKAGWVLARKADERAGIRNGGASAIITEAGDNAFGYSTDGFGWILGYFGINPSSGQHAGHILYSKSLWKERAEKGEITPRVKSQFREIAAEEAPNLLKLLGYYNKLIPGEPMATDLLAGGTDAIRATYGVVDPFKEPIQLDSKWQKGPKWENRFDALIHHF